MNSKVLIILTCLSIPAIILAQDCSNLNVLDWVLGEWQMESEKLVTTESWTKLSENTFDGKTQTISKKDGKVTFVETLRLVEMSGQIYYIAKVSHNEYPIPFELTECSDSTAVFVNRDHDFPKKLFYKLLDNGQMLNITVSNDERHFIIEYKRLN